jgi:hypothetical protein
MYQHLPLQDPPKFTQIWIFSLKTNHLAALGGTKKLVKKRRQKIWGKTKIKVRSSVTWQLWKMTKNSYVVEFKLGVFKNNNGNLTKMNQN